MSPEKNETIFVSNLVLSEYQRGKVTEEKSPEFWQLGIQSLSPTYGESMRLHIDTVFVSRLFDKAFLL